jgi:hypothetical protein
MHQREIPGPNGPRTLCIPPTSAGGRRCAHPVQAVKVDLWSEVFQCQIGVSPERGVLRQYPKHQLDPSAEEGAS